jgi:hypothetical protein
MHTPHTTHAFAVSVTPLGDMFRSKSCLAFVFIPFTTWGSSAVTRPKQTEGQSHGAVGGVLLGVASLG